MKCPVYAAPCPDHGFIHGAEAEELRSGIERLCAKYDKKVPIFELEELIQSVDARDSLAYLEANRKESTK